MNEPLLIRPTRLSDLVSSEARSRLAQLGTATLHMGMAESSNPAANVPGRTQRTATPRFNTARCRQTIERRMNHD